MTESQSTTRAKNVRARAILLGAALPVAIALAATLLMASWIPELPDPIAVHWTGRGPDGFGSAWPFILMPLGIVVLFSAFVCWWSWSPTPSGGISWNQKFLIATSVWMSSLLSLGIASSVAAQRGLADAHDAPDVGASMLLGATVGIVLAVVVWFLLPPGETVTEEGRAPRPVAVESGERIVWTRNARLGTAGIVVILSTLAVVAILLLFVTLSGRVLPWIVVVILALVAVLFATTTWWRVTIDHRGMLVSGALGWPRKFIPLAEVAAVDVVDVHPARDFGGWGWRTGGRKRSGIILRPGEGIEVTQSNGTTFVVTVDDASTGAGVLEALRTRT